MSVLRAFQLFQPIGGVRASPSSFAKIVEEQTRHKIELQITVHSMNRRFAVFITLLPVY
jgi:hypothetical protein